MRDAEHQGSNGAFSPLTRLLTQGSELGLKSGLPLVNGLLVLWLILVQSPHEQFSVPYQHIAVFTTAYTAIWCSLDATNTVEMARCYKGARIGGENGECPA